MYVMHQDIKKNIWETTTQAHFWEFHEVEAKIVFTKWVKGFIENSITQRLKIK